MESILCKSNGAAHNCFTDRTKGIMHGDRLKKVENGEFEKKQNKNSLRFYVFSQA